jgi:hypothetical protein
VTVVSRWILGLAFAAPPQSGLAWFCLNRGLRNSILHEAWLMKPTLKTRQGLWMLLFIALGCGLIVWLIVATPTPTR